MKNIGYQFIIVILSLINIFLNIETLEKDIYNVNVSEGYTNVGVPTNPNTSGFTKNILPIQSQPVQNTMNVPPVLKEEAYLSAAFEYSLGEARLIGDAGVMKTDVALTINPIGVNELPALNQGMVNVTGDNSGYRMLPKGMVFRDDINIILPYDSTLLPMGFTPNDIKTYFYHDTYKRWIEIERDSVDENNQLVISKVNHFTDFINAIIKTPEMPETASFAPTQMNDIKAANPLEGFTLMQPPTANNMGTANISYPLWIPNGRKGMQPNLSLNYNSSSNENGLMGLGWSLNLPMITTETRWGVPYHNAQLESETYLLNGEQLATKYIDESDNNKLKYNKLSHRAPWKLRPTIVDTTRFYPRVEGAFQKIIRHGTNPSNYWWEVIDKNGTKYYYGKKISQDVLDPNSVLVDYEGHICKWGITEIRDLNGNFVQYEYTIAGTYEVEKFLLIDKITYTGINNEGQLESGKYTIDFVKINRKFNDESTNCRLGVVEICNKLIDRVDIKYDNVYVKGYQFEYKKGEFGKTLLANLYEINDLAFYQNIFSQDNYDKLVKTHSFDYYEQIGEIFGDEVSINTVQDDEILGVSLPNYQEMGKGYGSTSNFDWNIGGSLDVGLYTDISTKLLSLGGNYMYTGGSSNDLMALIDIDGDGTPDKVFRDFFTGDLKYRKLGWDGTSYFFSEKNVLTWNYPFSKSKSHTHGFGVELQAKLNNLGVSLGYQRSRTKNYTNTYFVDVDGDGLIDISHNEKVYLNRPNNGIAFFTPFTSNMSVIGGVCETNDSIYYGDNIPSSYYSDGDTITTYIVNKEGMDSVLTIIKGEEIFLPDHDCVKMWVAPYNGTIHISSTTILALDLQNIRRETNIQDGIKLVIQKNGIKLHEYDLNTNDSIHYCSTSINVQRGDKLYFRIESGISRTFDVVQWNPRLKYTNYDGVQCDTNTSNSEGKKSFIFDAKNDFLVNLPLKYYMPLSGTGLVNIQSKISIEEELSDTLRVQIFKNNNLVLSRVYPKNTIVNNEIIDTIGLPIAYNDSIWFKVVSKTNVDWQKIKWMPILYYDSTTEQGISLYCVSPEGVENTPQIKWDVIPQYTYFANSHYPTIPFIPTQNIQLTSIIPNLSGYSGTEPIVFSIKDDNGVVFQKTLSLPLQNINVNITLAANEKYFFEWFTSHEYDLTTLQITNSSCIIAPGVSIPMGFYSNHLKDNIIFGNLYRNWGQFTYKRESENAIINESLLTLSNNALNLQLENITSTPDLTGNFEGDGFVNFSNAYDPLTENFLIMNPDIANNKWVGYANVTYVCLDTMSNTFYFEKTEDDVMFPDSVIVTSSAARSIKKMSKNISNQFSLSVGLGLPESLSNFFVDHGISFSYSKGTTFGDSYDIKNFIDMNGDRFPDVKTQYVINYTTPQGGISSETVFGCVPEIDWINDKTKNKGETDNVGGKYTYKISKTGENENREGGISLGGGTSNNHSRTKSTWIDINGDGLPDNLSDNGNYFLNVGYCYSEYPKQLLLNYGINDNFGISGGYSNATEDFDFNKFGTSFSGGVGYSDVTQTTHVSFLDINNDGLNDLISKSNNNIVSICYNNGNSFDTPIPISNITELAKSDGFSTNIYGSFGIGIPIWIIKIVINPQAGASWGMTHNLVDFIDINADGFVDYVQRDGDNIKVRFNQLTKVNTLKTVTNLAGGKFTIDYGLSQNSFDSPSCNLIMKSVKIDDGLAGDGEDILLKTFNYENPQYNRTDRESYGFETVITKDVNYSTQDVYRKLEEKYHNTEYSRKGLKYYESIKDGNNNMYVEKFFNYIAKEIETGIPINGDTPFCYGEGYPALNEEIVKYYEGGQTPLITTRVTYEHGPFGNIIQYHDYQNTNSSETNDDIIAIITYHEDLENKNILGIPQSITVTDINNIILRYRETQIDYFTGNVNNIQIFNDGTPSVYDYVYNSYGNIETVYLPENINDQRLSYSYKYDQNTHSYPIEIVNESFGYSSFMEYNFKFGKPTSTTDINGNQIKYEYDGWGRPTMVKSPLDPDSTIRFHYYIDLSQGNFGSWKPARTVHYDKFDMTNGIETCLIVDGLGRVVQTKKDIEIDGVEYRTVSGKQIYDAYGRVYQSYYPVTELVSLGINSLNTDIDQTPPTEITYDILDRQLSIQLPNTTTTNVSYTINGNYFENTMTDPMGNSTTKLTDTRGLNKEVIAPNNIITKFYYNPLGELTQSIDPENNSTYYTYNMLGQQVSRLHPDAGLDTAFYDRAGNLIWRQTQNLNGQTPINYSYDYNRLVNISYPLNPENNVYYFYGDINTPNNCIGRIWAIEDASGRQEFSYGSMGEVIGNVRTFALPNESNTYTFAMKFEYDSWNRILGTTYPDGEHVRYWYNKGGQLSKMESDYNNIVYPIIDSVIYNKFEQRTKICYGNGTKAEYQYDNLQRLTHLETTSASGVLQKIDYTFDNVNNITRIDNSAGVLNNGLGGTYRHDYTYDNIYRLSSSTGSWDNNNNPLGYQLDLNYSNDGRINQKILNADLLINGNQYSNSYNNDYFYNSGQSHTVTNVYDNNSQTEQNLEWDANGNLIFHHTEMPEPNDRYLCWDEENRLMAVKDNNYTSYYVYDNGGERTYKLSGRNTAMNINGNWFTLVHMDNPTLYTSGYLVANTQGYTKHYYAGSERISSAIGLGGLENIDIPLETNIYGSWEDKFSALGEEMDKTISGCLMMPYGIECNLDILYSLAGIGSGTMDRYFYHPDHIGSSSWITDGNGEAIQHLHYLPFGEDWVDQRNSSWNAPYTFSGKEKDVETGYGYFGARYYDNGLSIWLSVDPMSDKYPSMSPYNYCANNPVILVDPDGREFNPIFGMDGEFLGTDEFGLKGEAIFMKKSDFQQGMSHDKALSLGTLRSDFNPITNRQQDMLNKVDQFVNSLPNRPDWDGFVTKEEGIAWAKKHPNAIQNPTPENTLYLDASKLDFGNICISDLSNGVGTFSPVNLLNPVNIINSSNNSVLYNTIYALGAVNLFLHDKNGTVSIVNDEATDYDWNTGGRFVRSTLINNERAKYKLNDSHGFKVFYYGKGQIKK